MRRESVNTNARKAYTEANWLSRIIHWWLTDLLLTALKRPLTYNDIYGIPDSEKSQILTDAVNKEWQKELAKRENGGQARLWMALVRAFWLDYILYGIPTFMAELLKVIPSLFFAQMTLSYGSTNSNKAVFIYAAVFAISMIFAAVLRNWIYYLAHVIGVRVKSSTTSLIYRKILHVSVPSFKQTPISEIINVVSNDVPNLVPMTWFLLYPVYGVITVGIVLWYWQTEMGNIAWVGVVTIIALIPLQSVFSFQAFHYEEQKRQFTDERIKLINQIIGAIRIIKFYCWEQPFSKFVDDIRQEELSYLRKTKSSDIIAKIIHFNSARILTGIMVVWYYLIHNSLPGNAVFPTLAIVYALNDVIIHRCGLAFNLLRRGMISLKRVEKILLLNEVDTSNIVQNKEQISPPLILINVTSRWENDNSETFKLSDINLEILTNELIGIIGPVGAGKTSILMLILGEMQIVTGNININGTLGYVSQDPWIFSDTLRENVLFGNSFDVQRYEHVIQLCALHKDIANMSEGDQTLVGERGVKLSGGQKSRISLARALYLDADIYLFDDPLSAVDPEVGRHIFERCIIEELRGKTRIMVTHQLQYMNSVDKLVIIEQGSISFCGKYDEIIKSEIGVPQLFKYKEQKCNTNDKEINGTHPKTDEPDKYQESKIKSNEENDDIKLTGLTVIWKYLLFGNKLAWIILLFILTLTAHMIASLCDWWLSKWINDEQFADIHRAYSHKNVCYWETDRASITSLWQERKVCNIQAEITRHQNYSNVYFIMQYLAIHSDFAMFCLIVVLTFVVGMCQGMFFWHIVLRSAKSLHYRMLRCLLKLPVRYFDDNSIGKILTPFISDINAISDSFPDVLFGCNRKMMIVLSGLLVILAINPWTIILAIPIALLLTGVYHIFNTTNINLQHMENNSKQPVYNYLISTLEGLPVIRAFRVEKICIGNFENGLDELFGIQYNVAWCFSWMSFYSIFIGALFVIGSVFVMLAQVTEGNISHVGLSMVLSLQLTSYFHDILEYSSRLTSQSPCIDRCISYTKLPEEGDWISQCSPPTNWPTQGEIMVNNLRLSYCDSGPEILKGLSCMIEAKEHIGIVGRTGAGKSSFVQCLFRMADYTGTLAIDGVDIKEIGLHDLRSKISIVPQDPMLFTGTLRRNLDPTNRHTNLQLWNVLESVHMAEAITNRYGQLQMYVSENGTNFSVGQRQLLCLARSLLLENKIVILDEATANVDRKTDELIQMALQQRCTHCTIITVAHRLNTVIHYDRIIVLEDGEIKEIGIPHILLQNKHGYLSQMVRETGTSEQKSLIKIAKQVFHKKNMSNR